MRLGICIYSVKHAAVAQRAGFDYFEFPLSKLVAMADEEFNDFCGTVQKLQFFPEVMVKMLEPSQHLTGEEVDTEALRAYCRKGFERCSRIGVKGFVFGSDGARNLPPNFTDRMRAYDQLADFLVMVSDMAEPYGYHFYIEPLTMRNGKGANIITFIGEAAYLALRVNRENVRVMVDYYHSANNYESMQMIPLTAPLLEHFHFSTLDRKYPRPDDGINYDEFFDALKQIDYKGRITIEAKTPEDFEAAARMAYLRMKPYL